MRESGQQLERLAKQIGPSCVEKARPYYDSRMKARRAHTEAQRAAARFEKASNAHEAAKEMVTLAEEGYKDRGSLGFDQAWQEMLNHASSRVMSFNYDFYCRYISDSSFHGSSFHGSSGIKILSCCIKVNFRFMEISS
jgi:hypothetical protein